MILIGFLLDIQLFFDVHKGKERKNKVKSFNYNTTIIDSNDFFHFNSTKFEQSIHAYN